MSSSDGAGKVFHQMAGLFWPQGDPDELRHARDLWRRHAADIAAVRQAAEGVVRDLLAENQGPAMDAVAAYWRKWEGAGGYFDTAAGSAESLAHALDQYAQEIDSARSEIEHLAEAAAAVVAVGLVLTVVTAGASDAAAGAAAEGLVSEAVAVGLRLLAAIRTIASVVLRNAALGALESMAVDTAIQVARVELLRQQAGFSATELWHAGEAGAAAGAIAPGLAGGLGRLAARLAPGLANAAPALTQIPAWAQRAAAGSALGAGTNALVDEITTGRVEPLDIAVGAVGGALAGATGREPIPARSSAETAPPPLSATRLQIEAKYKHAADFGVTQPRGAAGMDAYEQAARQFVSNPATIRVRGTYRGEPAILNYDPATRLVVVQSPSGDFVSGWRMSSAQLQNVEQQRSLGGG